MNRLALRNTLATLVFASIAVAQQGSPTIGSDDLDDSLISSGFVFGYCDGAPVVDAEPHFSGLHEACIAAMEAETALYFLASLLGTTTSTSLVICDGVGTSSPPCPCANPGNQDQGCRHSGGSGAWLSVLDNSFGEFQLAASLLPVGNGGIFLSGTVGTSGVAVFDGVTCVGGSTLRLQAGFETHPGHRVSSPGALTAEGNAASPGYFFPGNSYAMTYWFRDVAAGPSPCGTGANFTTTLLVPLSTFGVTVAVLGVDDNGEPPNRVDFINGRTLPFAYSIENDFDVPLDLCWGIAHTPLTGNAQVTYPSGGNEGTATLAPGAIFQGTVDVTVQGAVGDVGQLRLRVRIGTGQPCLGAIASINDEEYEIIP